MGQAATEGNPPREDGPMRYFVRMPNEARWHEVFRFQVSAISAMSRAILFARADRWAKIDIPEIRRHAGYSLSSIDDQSRASDKDRSFYEAVLCIRDRRRDRAMAYSTVIPLILVASVGVWQGRLFVKSPTVVSYEASAALIALLFVAALGEVANSLFVKKALLKDCISRASLVTMMSASVALVSGLL